MLLNFKVKNVFSFKEFTEFSMIAGPVKRKIERVEERKNCSVLKFSAIYGANASGKSKLIEALDVMRKLTISGKPKLVRHYYYKLDENCKNEASYFEVELNLKDKNYAYGFTFNFNKNVFESEWLYQLNLKNEKVIFNRDINNKIFDFNIDLEGELKEKFKVYVDDLKEDNDNLFLTTLLSKIKLLKDKKLNFLLDILVWFIFKLDITTPNSIITSSDYYVFNEKLSELSTLLKAFGTGIDEIKTINVSEREIENLIDSKRLDEIKEDFSEHGQDDKLALLRTDSNFSIIEMKKGEISYKKVIFYHDGNNMVDFSIDEESEGTIRLLDLAEILLTKEKNKVFVIDELDRCLHPQVTMKFISLFLERAKKYNNQLIVTTHESRLLDFEILRRDEIWFVNKDKNGSKLYSLEQYNERFDKKIDKAYLDGRYGGVPIFDNIFPVDIDE